MDADAQGLMRFLRCAKCLAFRISDGLSSVAEPGVMLMAPGSATAFVRGTPQKVLEATLFIARLGEPSRAGGARPDGLRIGEPVRLVEPARIGETDRPAIAASNGNRARARQQVQREAWSRMVLPHSSGTHEAKAD